MHIDIFIVCKLTFCGTGEGFFGAGFLTAGDSLFRRNLKMKITDHTANIIYA